MDENAYEALRALNNNVAGLLVVSVAICDELHMIRQCMEGRKGEYSDPVASSCENYEIDYVEPVFV